MDCFVALLLAMTNSEADLRRPRLLQQTMNPCAIRYPGYLALALLSIAPRAVAMDAAELPAATANAMAQSASPQAIAEYRRKLSEYRQARAAFDEEASAY